MCRRYDSLSLSVFIMTPFPSFTCLSLISLPITYHFPTCCLSPSITTTTLFLSLYLPFQLRPFFSLLYLPSQPRTFSSHFFLNHNHLFFSLNSTPSSPHNNDVLFLAFLATGTFPLISSPHNYASFSSLYQRCSPSLPSQLRPFCTSSLVTSSSLPRATY